MVDRSDPNDVQVEQKLGDSTAIAALGEKGLDSSFSDLDSRAGYADFPVHQSSSRHHEASDSSSFRPNNGVLLITTSWSFNGPQSQ